MPDCSGTRSARPQRFRELRRREERDAVPYARGEAEGAIADAQKILEFCRRRLPRP
jgi:hypothetical protein